MSSNKELDMMYGFLFNQLLRYKLSPTYVEKRILIETVNTIRNYLLKYSEVLKEKLDLECKRCLESYLTWDVDFYKENGESNKKIVSDFEKKIKETSEEKFLNIDFSKTESDLDRLFPDVLPYSSVRETLCTQWNKIEDKHK